MKIGTFLLSLGAVAVVGFVAGRSELSLCEMMSVAAAQDSTHGGMPEMTDEQKALMAAWDKAGTPGEHHKIIDQMEGTWDASYSFTMEPGGDMMTSTGTVKREWILNKHYLKETVNAEGFTGEPFEGLGFVGYNNIDGVYEVIWMDNTSTQIMKETGTYDAASKKMKFKGVFKDPVTGSEIPTRSEVDLSNPNRHVFIGWMMGPDGKEFEHMKGVTEKK